METSPETDHRKHQLLNSEFRKVTQDFHLFPLASSSSLFFAKEIIFASKARRGFPGRDYRYFLYSGLFTDINELTLPKTCATDFPNPDDLLNFKLIICPDEGFYKGGRFVFNFRVGPNYPHEPPKVKCETQVYHPNIDLEGNVCLNILREDWKPVLTINSVVYGLQYLFLVSCFFFVILLLYYWFGE